MNPTVGMFQTLVAAANRASESLRFRNALVEAIFWQYQPIAASPYQTLNVIIPTVNEGGVVDIQAGPIQPVDYSYNNPQITLSKNFSVSIIVKSWDVVPPPRRQLSGWEWFKEKLAQLFQ